MAQVILPSTNSIKTKSMQQQLKAKRVFINPIFGDKATFLETSEETKGAYSLGEVELAAGGGNFPHYHEAFHETFTVIDGILSVQLKNKWLTLEKGDSFTVPPGAVHCFKNKTAQKITFRVKVVPGHEGFENSIKILYGLATDGLTTKKGAPKKLSHIALLFKLGDIKQNGFFSLLAPFFNWIGKRAHNNGTEQQLINRYCN
jgi:quercetin dioxygenase-like cupin family protein